MVATNRGGWTRGSCAPTCCPSGAAYRMGYEPVRRTGLTMVPRTISIDGTRACLVLTLDSAGLDRQVVITWEMRERVIRCLSAHEVRRRLPSSQRCQLPNLRVSSGVVHGELPGKAASAWVAIRSSERHRNSSRAVEGHVGYGVGSASRCVVGVGRSATTS